jgi:hypothetical protein
MEVGGRDVPAQHGTGRLLVKFEEWRALAWGNGLQTDLAVIARPDPDVASTPQASVNAGKPLVSLLFCFSLRRLVEREFFISLIFGPMSIIAPDSCVVNRRYALE